MCKAYLFHLVRIERAKKDLLERFCFTFFKIAFIKSLKGFSGSNIIERQIVSLINLREYLILRNDSSTSYCQNMSP